MKKITTFFINGFLDSGKTQFILATIRRDEFYKRGSTLIICCEQGENEYDEVELEKYKTKIVYIDSQKDFSPSNLRKLYDKYKPNRVVIEMNMMWKINDIELPANFEVSQFITLIDGTTFPVYFSNMRQLFVDCIKLSDVVAFTKLDNRDSLASFQTTMKVINSQCFYCLINENCVSTMEAFETPLPYNRDLPEIDIKDKDFGDFYIDTFDNRDKYEGKIVSFNAWVAITDSLPKNSFVACRKVLNCCADDIQIFGFLVNSFLGQNIENDSWVRLKAVCHVEFVEEYQEEEIILTPLEIAKIQEIDEPILDLR